IAQVTILLLSRDNIPGQPWRALPRRKGELGEEPAARREKEPPAVSAVELVPPPINLPRPRSGPHSPSGGMGAASPHICDFFSSRNRTSTRINRPISFSETA